MGALSAKPELMAQQPLVSVILPVYQGEDLILKSVYSVLNQTYTNLELIVIDDGSTDGTLGRLATVSDPRLHVIPKRNEGVSVARNLGISKARGEYIAFLDADDLWFPEKLAVDLETVARHGEPVCLVYSWFYGVDDRNRLVNLSPSFRDAGNIAEFTLKREGAMLPSTTLMHRQVFDVIGGFPTDSYHEDRVFFINACRRFPAFPTEQRTVVYRQSTSGRCRSILKDYDVALEAELSIMDALRSSLSEAELELVRSVQIKNLVCRFLMYGYLGSARRLNAEHGPVPFEGGLKDKLARLSLMSGINLLTLARVTYQLGSKNLMLPWWRLKSAALHKPQPEKPLNADLQLSSC
jgi:glycosyltransferase involved in cell wall biosynthesis